MDKITENKMHAYNKIRSIAENIIKETQDFLENKQINFLKTKEIETFLKKKAEENAITKIELIWKDSHEKIISLILTEKFKIDKNSVERSVSIYYDICFFKSYNNKELKKEPFEHLFKFNWEDYPCEPLDSISVEKKQIELRYLQEKIDIIQADFPILNSKDTINDRDYIYCERWGYLQELR